MAKSEDLQLLQTTLGYTFKDARLLERALVHASSKSDNNEKLEFLGDAALGFAVATIIYRTSDSLSIGQIAQLKANLINNRHLTEVAKGLGIERVLFTGLSVQNGTSSADKVFADALEAVIGAIYLDGGFEAMIEFVREKILTSKFSQLSIDKHPKTALQEWAVAHGNEAPKYYTTENREFGNEPDWTALCNLSLDGVNRVTGGVGSSKRDAERKAAERMLKILIARAGRP